MNALKNIGKYIAYWVHRYGHLLLPFGADAGDAVAAVAPAGAVGRDLDRAPGAAGALDDPARELRLRRGVEAGGVEDAVVLAEELGDQLLQLAVDVQGAADESHRT
mgnify:CR=1 FL=1